MAEILLEEACLSGQETIYPALDTRGCSLYYTNSNVINQAVVNKSGKAVPIVIPASTSSLDLRIRFRTNSGDGSWLHHIRNAIKNAGQFDVYPKPQNGTQIEAPFAKGEYDSSHGDDNVKVEDLALKITDWNLSFIDKERPWSIVGSIQWEINTESFRQIFSLDIEIYAIQRYILPFMKREGIPINLLRFALKPRKFITGRDPRDQEYTIDVTHRVFNSGFLYDRLGGGGAAFAPGAGKAFALSKWLKIWSVINGTASEETRDLYHARYHLQQPTVNCMDQAALLGLCLSFSCQSQDELNCIRACLARPFGYITTTKLVGFHADCNNPFVPT